MPLIATTSCRKLEDYKQALLHTGGEVRIVDPSMTVNQALDGADGLLLTGGEDIDPSRYHQPKHESVVDVDPVRDEFELALIAEARKRQLPIFAICRGVQVLNVACGGTLIQDIPTEVPGSLDHRLTS